ncbi:MAG: aminotransferase class V-fold PLP-dependent enzyme [Candidatus Aminicenantes bacterium]|nr:aminotransferase class V-fold PLP-dependent enzyme [Candidatus Aminicenantes bacterium]
MFFKDGRRAFLKTLGLTFGSLKFFSLEKKADASWLETKIKEIENLDPLDVAQDESFWFHVQEAFDVDRSLINLNNGGVHPAPRLVMQALHRYLDFANAAPTVNSWGYIRTRREFIRQKIAETFGCSPEEIAITRNVTESLQIVLLGIDLKPGDEIITTTHDYPSMKNALFQREKREGIKVKLVPFPYPALNKQELVDCFAQNITPRTKMILVCHITNLTGQIFPVKDISQLAREKGIELVIDGAHSFGHLVDQQKDLDCDIYGGNLHKWMMAPIGTGFLYVKKEKIKKIWPLFPSPDPQSDDIRKFEHYGTHPEPIWLAIGEALSFHHTLGPKRKEERLRYLKDYWAKALAILPGVKILTSFNPELACGLGSFTVEGRDMLRLSQILMDKHRIHTTAGILPDGVPFMRITPSIYTTLKELDYFIEIISHYIKTGWSA